MDLLSKKLSQEATLRSKTLSLLIHRKAFTYGQQPLHLDGQMDLNIKFGESCVCETVYIKLDAPDTLLLSENVCHTLKILAITLM